MSTEPPGGFSFEITEEDLRAIRAAVARWNPGLDPALLDGSRLFFHAAAWASFVATNWEGWDVSEYDHDIGCRDWIQIALENATNETRKALERHVAQADGAFKMRMGPRSRPMPTHAPLKDAHYFWHTHTIHPDE